MNTMPRGNDALAAGRESLDRFGDHLHAEDLIRAHAATINPALNKILSTPYDEEETAAVQADLSKAETLFSEGKSSGDLEEGEQLLSAAVHGNAIVAVIETVHGDTRKAYAPYNEKFAEPSLSPAEEARFRAAQEEGHVAAETAKIRRDAQARLADEREKIERETEEELARIRKEQDERVAAAKDETDAAADAARERLGDDPVTDPVAETKQPSSTTRKSSTKKKTAARKKSAAKK